jgi:SpoVK/Ycf46/Vps4 family AAA+-type ATPase
VFIRGFELKSTESVRTSSALPAWLNRIVDLYNSHACNQFILTGNTHDLFPANENDLVTLPELIAQSIVPRYNIVLTYDIGNGIRLERGADLFTRWQDRPEVASKHPRTAIELITLFLRYAANLAVIATPNETRLKVAVILKDAQLFASNSDADTNALAFLIREWSREPHLTRHDIVSFILTENTSDLHPLLRNNSQAAHINVPLPAPADIEQLLVRSAATHNVALSELKNELPHTSRQLAGSTLHSIVNLLKLKEHQREPLHHADLARTKAQLIERECPDLIEILPPRLNLDQVQGQEALKKHLRENIALWREQKLDLIPMGYLICGPVGTGKTFLVRCLAGEANVPVVVLKNFRDKWYGSTESNLEKIFRTIKAIGECYVFIDEADQSLGRRDSSGSEPAVSGRIYSMLAQEMSNKENRGRIVWILATSRPDLVEVDLKRPGRIDLKIPLFPTTTPEEGFQLIQSIAAHHGLKLDPSTFAILRDSIPDLLTPGEVESLLTELRRETLLNNEPLEAALQRRFKNYIPPIPHETILAQIHLALTECSKPEYIPARFRP